MNLELVQAPGGAEELLLLPSLPGRLSPQDPVLPGDRVGMLLMERQ